VRPHAPHSFKIREEIQKIKPYVPGKPIDEVKRELGLEDVIKLASNELPFGPPERVREAIFEAVREVNRYPDANSYYLRMKLAQKFGMPPETIVLGNGSSELLKLIAEAVVMNGDRVIYADPSFVMYPIITAARGGISLTVPLRKSDLAHDLEAMLDAVDESISMVIICNPNNPTGTITPRDEILRFLEKLPDGILVIFDEAYAEFVTDDNFISGLELIKKGWPNVVVLRSFSKAYGLAGLRLGYGFLPEELAEAVNRIREPFNVNLVAQYAALAALEEEEEYARIRSEVIFERERLEERLKQEGFKVYQSQANFVFVDAGVDSRMLFGELLKEGVIVRDGSIFGKDFATFLRVTIGTPEENDRFLKAFLTLVAEVKRGGMK
jgi:histidinol-phosphate aminotransferase